MVQQAADAASVPEAHGLVQRREARHVLRQGPRRLVLEEPREELGVARLGRQGDGCGAAAVAQGERGAVAEQREGQGQRAVLGAEVQGRLTWAARMEASNGSGRGAQRRPEPQEQPAILTARPFEYPLIEG